LDLYSSFDKMNPLEQHLTQYLVHSYNSFQKGGKLVEVGLYSVDRSDIKFRVIKFVDGAFKEIFTSEKREEAVEKFDSLSRK
jgi:hypothetical protein